MSVPPGPEKPRATPVPLVAPNLDQCPCLSSSVEWDAPDASRGELLPVELLEAHAAQLASSQGAPAHSALQGPLRARFVAARTRVKEAYTVLSRVAPRRRELSLAEEWLLDNSHIVEDQLREIQEDLPAGYLVQLPRIATGTMAGYPCVYGLCLDYLRHTDARIDLATLTRYVVGYQTVRDLTIGELWAVPIMLRLGLVMRVGALAASEAKSDDRVRGDAWAEKLFSTDQASPELLEKAIDELENDRPSITQPFLVHLLRRLREHDAPFGTAFEWIGEQSHKLGYSPEELARREHLRQAADQVSVGNAITSMRLIAALDWGRFFERTSSVEAILRNDPAAAYELTEKAARDRYRHAVEELARRSHGDECLVASAAVDLSTRAAKGHTAERHVGYYLIGLGREALEQSIGYRPSFSERLRRVALAYPTAFYLGSVLVLSVAIVGWLALEARDMGAGSAFIIGALALLAILPATDLAVTLVNSLVTMTLKPKLLAKLDLSDGIPPELTTLVVVPAMLDHEAAVKRLLADLEIRSLANTDDNLYFALITDHTDHDSEISPRDAALLASAKEGISKLNRLHRGNQPHRFSLFHRRRLHNPAQGCWMGWERKRGKLEELNRLLRGASDTTFTDVTLPAKLFAGIRYVITLDADTELPREVARKLVATIAHPLNRARWDEATGRIVEGHGLIQPGVGIEPLSARESRYARIMAGQVGIDPYTSASADVYQDLFGSGSYVGKAIYDIDAFAAAVDGRVPENRLLSHDLFEGLLAHAALATDIELLDDQPTSYSLVARRQHRWIRGDWQLIEWLWSHVPTKGDERRKNDLSLIARWKLFDNLRRSLVPVASVALLVFGWALGRAPAAVSTVLVAAALALPAVGRLLLALTRPKTDTSPSLWAVLRTDVGVNALRALLAVVFLLDQAFITADAVVRTMHRLWVSKTNLLEWTTASQAAQNAAESGRTYDRRMALGSFSSAALLATLIGFSSPALPWAAPLLVTWIFAPFLATWLSRPLPTRDRYRSLSGDDRGELRLYARKTWLFFETFVTAEDNWLPPDNYQEDPRGVVAHRTSPTNIGLYLLSTVAARDFGYLTLGEVTTRLAATLRTVSALDKRNGHVLNWYDTTTLRPLDPQYVSTVDSGNLAGYLWTLREACLELRDAKIVNLATVEGALDAVRLASRSTDGKETIDAAHESLERAFADARLAFASSTTNGISALRKLRDAVRDADVDPALPPSSRQWLVRAARELDLALAEANKLAPHLAILETAPSELADLGPKELWSVVASTLTLACTPKSIRRAVAFARTKSEALLEACATLEDPGASARVSAFLSSLEEKLSEADAACETLESELVRIADLAGSIADDMSFGFLYDRERSLFSIGYDIGGARLDASHYDLLASEARLASLVAIAKGDIPVEHWFRLGRPRTGLATGASLLAWTGSMFEFLMPLLVTRSYEGTLLDETCASVVARQRAYGDEQGVPWGISESAYNLMDLTMTYQYRAFGVPGLGLKAGLANDLVVAPYATMLASLVDASTAAANLRRMSRDGLEGSFGYYESIDYTPMRVPPGRKGVIVKAYMAHHQGMTLVALDNVLSGSPMQRRFHAHPPIKASELLLEERVPTSVPSVEVRTAGISPVASANEAELDFVEHVGLAAKGPLRAHLIGHGDISTLVTSLGTGVTTWKGLDVHRFREDGAAAPSGVFVYLRDLTNEQVWSAGYEPTRRNPDRYDAAFSPDRIEIHRRDGDVETVMAICVSPEHPAEVRRITVTNHGSSEKTIELTAYTEVVLASRAADIAHRAFSNMFVETEALPEKSALLARRKPRSPSDKEAWMVQVLASEGAALGPFEFDTSRAAFIGRGRTIEAPRALDRGAKLAGSVGALLDPALVLRRTLTLGPGEHARIALSTALADSREGALELVDTFSGMNSVTRAFELGWADARVELKHLGMNGTEADRSQKLLSAVLFPQPELRHRPPPSEIHGDMRSALWGLGVSGDLPLMVLRIDDPDFGDLCRAVLVAQELWRLNGIAVDFVILNEEPSGYNQPLQEGALGLVRSSMAQSRVDQPGGVFVRRADQMSPTDRTLLLVFARVVLLASSGSLGRQLRSAASEGRAIPDPTERRLQPKLQSKPSRPLAKLSFDNGTGGFSADGREYVMRIGAGRPAPAPWCNVIANPTFGSVVSETGSAFTWSTNSQSHRLTPWSNDAVSDPSGEVVYVRDEEDGAVWSATPLPAGGEALYEVRHGQGYSVFSHSRNGLDHELTLFVDEREPVRFARLSITNRGTKKRRLSVAGYVEWVLGNTRERSRLSVVTEIDATNHSITAFNPASNFSARRAFFASTHPATATADRAELIGRRGSRARPAGLDRALLQGRSGVGLDPCGALLVPLELGPGESEVITFVLGEGNDAEHVRSLVSTFAKPAAVTTALRKASDAWDARLSTITVKTPDLALDLMANRWLLYQALGARVWARSGFYQSGGAYGFRDQLQDVLALVHAAPGVAREHILRSAARQFEEGDVQHWWHPETGEGVRTRCSDDMLWLPYVTAEYVRATGDDGILDEIVPFLHQALLEPEQHDHFTTPSVSGEKASLYEHCTRALVRGTTSGIHGLPLMQGGDWNDGMNRIGEGGRGESVWLAWFLAKTMRDFAPLAEGRGDHLRKEQCLELADQLCGAVDAEAWDGEWYLRAFFDDGSPVGSAKSTECRIDAIAQSWAAIAGGGDPERARAAVLKSDEMLRLPDEQMMRLFVPPFARSEPSPGYIQGYPEGVRENGGQYTHGVLWTALALTALGEGDRAVSLLDALSPIRHATTEEAAARYGTEPYVVAADVYAAKGFMGRGGWSWYTGSASWMYRIIIEHVLGIRLVGGRIAFSPCIPKDWKTFEVDYRGVSGLLHITVDNPQGLSRGSCVIKLDGRPVAGGAIDLPVDGNRHEVHVVITAETKPEVRASLPIGL